MCQNFTVWQFFIEWDIIQTVWQFVRQSDSVSWLWCVDMQQQLSDDVFTSPPVVRQEAANILPGKCSSKQIITRVIVEETFIYENIHI